MSSLRIPDIGPRDATMTFQVGAATIYNRSSTMANYEKTDPATVAAKRRNDMVSGRSLVPAGGCHFCGHMVGKGALWCSTGCAQDYATERQAVRTE